MRSTLMYKKDINEMDWSSDIRQTNARCKGIDIINGALMKG